MRVLGSANLQKIVEEVGPLLAGFQIAVSIVGFFGIGAVAKWILTNWFPFTRFIWSEILAFLHLPEITFEEKDALTTLAFFAPMAVSSLYVWSARNNTNVGDHVVDRDDVRKEIRLRVYASLIGATFMVIIGGRVIQDAVTLFTTDAPDIEAPVHDAVSDAETLEEQEQPLLDMQFFATLGLFVSVLIGLGVLTLAIYWLTRQNRWLASKTDSLLVHLTKYAKPITLAIFEKFSVAAAASGVFSALSSLFSLLSFSTFLGGIIFAAGQLGAIRTISPILVLCSLLATIFLNPGRLLKTAGVVIALVLASLGWDAAVWVVEEVEKRAGELA